MKAGLHFCYCKVTRVTQITEPFSLKETQNISVLRCPCPPLNAGLASTSTRVPSLIHSSFESLQGWRLLNLFRSLLRYLTTLTEKNCWNFPCCNFCCFFLILLPGISKMSMASSSLNHSSAVEYSNYIPLSKPLFRLIKPSSLSCFFYAMSSSPLIIPAPTGLTPVCGCLSLLGCPKPNSALQMQSHNSQLEGNHPFSSAAGCTFTERAQDDVGLHRCKGSLLMHVQLLH